MRLLISEHGRKRLKDFRQDGIVAEDLQQAGETIPGHIPRATRFRGFVAHSGRVFDLVVKDTDNGRLVITVIGRY